MGKISGTLNWGTHHSVSASRYQWQEGKDQPQAGLAGSGDTQGLACCWVIPGLLEAMGYAW